MRCLQKAHPQKKEARLGRRAATCLSQLRDKSPSVRAEGPDRRSIVQRYRITLRMPYLIHVNITRFNPTAARYAARLQEGFFAGSG
jgi:hypothetical protein